MHETSSLRIRTVLVEDHQLVAAALQTILAEDPMIEVLGCASNGTEAVMLAKAETPDVLLLDLQLPGMHGVEVLREVCTFTKVCIVSMHDDVHHVVQAMRSGARGYICKTARGSCFREAVHAVARGDLYMCPQAEQAGLQAGRSSVARKPDLSERETEVLHLAALGKNIAEIATKLEISRRTAEAHRASLMKKLALKNQTELVLYALRCKMITA